MCSQRRILAAVALLLVCLFQEGAAASATDIVTKTSTIPGLNCNNVCLDAQTGGVSYKQCVKGFDKSGVGVSCGIPATSGSIPLTCQCKTPTTTIYLTTADGTIITTVTGRNIKCLAINRACTACSQRRLPGTGRTGMVCTQCAAGWRLRPDGLSQTCDCAPGFYLNGTTIGNWCTPCKRPQYCTGGDAVNNPGSLASDCEAGLGTVIDGAKSNLQCTALAGYGRSTSLSADGSTVVTEVSPCPVGTWNSGGNTAPCTNCPAGLTTAAPGAYNVTQCVAPPGSYIERGVGKLCPKGTYQPDYNTMTFCYGCPVGLTTPSEGHNASMACQLAIKGYHTVNTTAAEPCPQGTYNDQEAAVTQCTVCPFGYQTQSVGATGEALCFAPPGYELLPGAQTITQCPVNWYKEGWNRNPCLQCGDGLMTAGAGSVSKDDCGVPPGYGVVNLSPLKAEMCTNNRYGMNVTRPAIADSRCQTCPPNMYTRDVISGVPATAGYQSFKDCLVKPGYGIGNGGLVVICEPGTYNPGYNQESCKPCAAGYTTDPEKEGATSVMDCRVVPGWVVSTTFGVPQPCDKGTYSPGGTEADPHPSSCIKCPAGFTTQEDESKAPEDCSYCVSGYGGANCTQCPYNTYSAGGLEAGTACSQCPLNQVSSRRSTDGDHCVTDMMTAENDFFPLSDDSAWTADSSATTADACRQSCRANTKCAMYRFAVNPAANGDKCYLLLEDASGTSTWGFKGGAGSDYALYQFSASLKAGILTQTIGTVTAQQCMDACTKIGRCELFVISISSVTDPTTLTPCELYRSDLDSDWQSMYHIQGNRLYSDVLLPDAQFPSIQSPPTGRKLLMF